MENYCIVDSDFTKEITTLNYKNNHRYLLNLDKEEYDILEKYVYDSAVFHLSQQSLESQLESKTEDVVTDTSNNIHSYFVEFWIKNRPLLDNLHIDCDEHEIEINNKYIFPTKSIITYLNDHLYPTLFTNVDIEKYKYKYFDKENNIVLIFPKKNTQVSFDGSKYHGEIKLNEISEADDDTERLIIAINIWKHNPTNVDFYESCLDVSTTKYNKTPTLIKISIIPEKHMIDASKQFNESLFNKLLYKNDISICSLFKDKILEGLTKDIYCINILDNSIYNYQYNEPLLQVKVIMNDLENISSEKINQNNRFLQRFVYENFFSNDLCKWILFEVKEFGKTHDWKLCRHQNYSTVDIPLQVLENIFKYCLYSFCNLFKKIFKSYCIPENYTADVKDMFVVKYEMYGQKSLISHEDGTHLSFNIMLSDTTDYEGGGTYFYDGLTYYLNAGDVLVHSGFVKHGSHDITKGERFVLVVFFDIVEKKS